MNKWIKNLIISLPNKNRGMTYVELIVVLSIFAIMSAVVIFNYKDFQSRIDIRNLANDIALKFAEAQKSAVSGKLPVLPPPSPWKPSYGIFLNASDLSPSSPLFSFVYFVDRGGNDTFDGIETPCGETGECLNIITIGRGNFISAVESIAANGSYSSISSDVHITFERPGSNATIVCSSGCPNGTNGIRITVQSPAETNIISTVSIFSSGRIQIN